VAAQSNDRQAGGGDPPYNCDSEQKLYIQTFVRNYGNPYGLQRQDGPWTTRDKHVSDRLVGGHLAQKYWVAKAAAFYPDFFYLDFDGRLPALPVKDLDVRPGRAERRPDHSVEGRIAAAVERLELGPGQYYIMTSPSHKRDGSCHLVLRLEHRGEMPVHKYGYVVLRRLVGDLCEIYPQEKRKFRLPLGRDQFLISEEGSILRELGWRAATHFINKLDPVAIEALPYRPSSAKPDQDESESRWVPTDPPADNPRTWATRETCEHLWRHGLQQPGTRHHRQWDLAIYFRRENRPPGETVAELKDWIRWMHNGMSKSVNRGDWQGIESEIERQVAWIYERFKTYPDDVHNARGGLTAADLRWIAEVFRGDLVNQRRLARLLNYYRPRARRHEEVFVPYHVWHTIAHKRHYHQFIRTLEAMNLMESDMRYWHDTDWPELSFCRKFRLLRLPPESGQPLRRDGLNITDYDQALFAAFGSVSEIADATGVCRQRFYDRLKREGQALAAGWAAGAP
jgi:hypothetical protein